MAVPKKRKSASRRDMRRSHLAISPVGTVTCPNCGEPMRPHRICASCGYYRGTERIRYEEEA